MKIQSIEKCSTPVFEPVENCLGNCSSLDFVEAVYKLQKVLTITEVFSSLSSRSLIYKEISFRRFVRAIKAIIVQGIREFYQKSLRSNFKNLQKCLEALKAEGAAIWKKVSNRFVWIVRVLKKFSAVKMTTGE